MTYLITYIIADSNDYEYRVLILFDTPLTTTHRILRDFLDFQFDGAIYRRNSDDGLTTAEALAYLDDGKAVAVDEEQTLKWIGICTPPKSHIDVLRRYLQKL